MAASDPRVELMQLLLQGAALPPAARSRWLGEAVRLLGDPQIPWELRRLATARLLRLLPDRRRYIWPLLHALTTSLNRHQTWECLRWLQEAVPRCHVLDQWLERWQRRRRWRCPRCDQRLNRAALVRHLWEAHGLLYDHTATRAVPLGNLVHRLRQRWQHTGDPQLLVQAWIWKGENALRRWLRLALTAPEDFQWLCRRAEERGCGLCPICFAELPASLPPLPAPLNLCAQQLSAPGWYVSRASGPWCLSVSVHTPHHQAVVQWRPAPRLLACLAALGPAALLVALLPPTIAAPLLLPAAVAIYALVRARLPTVATSDDELIDTAWQHLVPTCRLDQAEHLRWLTRLCLTSVGRGTPARREPFLRYLLAELERRCHAADNPLADACWQLRSAAEGLQLCDASHYPADGDEHLLRALARPFYGEVPWNYAATLAAVCLALPLTPGRLRRWQIRLWESAFAAGWNPRELQTLAATVPILEPLLVPTPPAQLAHLYTLYHLGFVPAWSAEIYNVFELARHCPAYAEQILSNYPDLLWLEHWDPLHERSLGPIITASRGVCLAGCSSLDPDAEIRLAASGCALCYEGQWVYTWWQLPPDLPERLRDWLRLLHRFLHMTAEQREAASPLPLHTLQPLARRCPHCRSRVLIPRGQVGRRLAALRPPSVKPPAHHHH